MRAANRSSLFPNAPRLFRGSTLALALAAASTAWGQSDNPFDTPQSESQPNQFSDYSLLFGLQPAYLLSTPSDNDREGKRGGLFTGGKILLSFASEGLVLNGGVGWFRSRISGDDPFVTTQSGSKKRRERVTVVGTQAGYLDFQGLFRKRDLFLGPTALVMFGADTSFAPVEGDNSSSVLLGGTIGWIERNADYDLRIGLRYDTDLTIRDRQLHLIGATIDFGIPFGPAPDSRTIIKERVEYKDRVEIRPVEVVKFQLSSELVNFETDSNRLLPSSRLFLENLARMLMRHTTLWQGLVIEGHTDSRGNSEHNQQLSYLRARSVATILTEQGIASNRLQTVGVGSTRPIDSGTTAVALARNRRVELRFTSVSDAKTLSAELDRVRLQSRTPETCGPQGCK
jgi:outer membrane protein OmpA-like peptidoglycan-associated protein